MKKIGTPRFLRMIYQALCAFMGLAAILFWLAPHLARRKITRWHRLIALAGVLTTVILGLWLIVSVQFVHGGDALAAGIRLADPALLWPARIHRALATLCFALMLYLAWTGIRGAAGRHRYLGPAFPWLYSLVYISGVLLFRAA